MVLANRERHGEMGKQHKDINYQTPTTARLLTEMWEGRRRRASNTKLSTVACDSLMGRDKSPS